MTTTLPATIPAVLLHWTHEPLDPRPLQRCHQVNYADLCAMYVRGNGYRACRPPCTGGCDCDCDNDCPPNCDRRHDPQGIRPGDVWVIGSTAWDVHARDRDDDHDTITLVQRARTGRHL